MWVDFLFFPSHIRKNQPNVGWICHFLQSNRALDHGRVIGRACSRFWSRWRRFQYGVADVLALSLQEFCYFECFRSKRWIIDDLRILSRYRKAETREVQDGCCEWGKVWAVNRCAGRVRDYWSLHKGHYIALSLTETIGICDEPETDDHRVVLEDINGLWILDIFFTVLIIILVYHEISGDGIALKRLIRGLVNVFEHARIRY